jgi:hypothetical protein
VDHDKGVSDTYRVLGFSKHAFHRWRANPISQRDCDDAHLVDAARTIHADDPVFGYRFICDELAAELAHPNPQVHERT